MSRHAAPLALALVAAALAGGCSGNANTYLVVGVHAIPSGATQLIARAALDEAPAKMSETFAAPSGGFGADTTFALKLAPSSGRLSVSVEAWSGGCAGASHGADVNLADGLNTVEITLDTIDPPDCSGGFVHLPEMVRIPGAMFAMGCDATVDTQCETDEKPVHVVTISSFFIDRTEVSTAAYGDCQGQRSCSAPLIDQAASSTAESFITWDDADGFCRARGKRLATEAEWELAARGTDNRIYPWGNDAPTCEQANFSPSAGTNCYSVGGDVVGPVDHFTGASPYGVLGMAGNVEEWVADWYLNAYQPGVATDPTGPASGSQRVLRGGSSISTAEELRASRRDANAPDASAPSTSALTPQENSTRFGIRCARSQ